MADGLVGITRRYSALGQGRRRAVEPFNINGQWDSDSEDQGYKWACPELREISVNYSAFTSFLTYIPGPS